MPAPTVGAGHGPGCQHGGTGVRVEVYLELAPKRTFAGAVDWPGWCRSGRGEAEALAALLAYGRRYAAAIASGEPTFVPPVAPAELVVVERLQGDATTDFGAPSRAPSADARPLDEGSLERQLRLLGAAWGALDAAAAGARGLELRKGPRGGGRDLGAVLAHVLGAEVAYLARLGAKMPSPAAGDRGDELAVEREAIRDALVAAARGLPAALPSRSAAHWTARYFVRRAAWHVLDHAWEIEDRAIR